MRYIVTFLFLLTGLFAHSEGENHLHFFSSLHMESFLLLLSVLAAGLAIFKFFGKERN